MLKIAVSRLKTQIDRTKRQKCKRSIKTEKQIVK